MPPPTSAVNANLSSQTNKTYTRFLHFHSFFMPKNAFAVGAPSWTLLGEHPAPLAGGEGPHWEATPQESHPCSQPQFSKLRASVRPSQLQLPAMPIRQ